MSTALNEHLKSRGILHQLTVAYTPQQNSVTEKRNRTLIEATRCILDQSGLPKDKWTDAMRCDVYEEPNPIENG